VPLVLANAVAVVALHGLTIMNRLFQGIQHKAGVGSPADPPTNDIAGELVDDESGINESCPGRDIGEARDSQPVGRGRVELAVDLVKRTWSCIFAHHGAHRLAPDHTRQAYLAHQPFDCTASNIEPFTVQLPPYLADTIHTEVGIEHTPDLYLHYSRALLPIGRLQQHAVITPP
jgi:hypothetical protein